MIAKLALADVVTNLRVWTGVLVVTAVTAFVGALTAGIVESGIRHGGLVALALYAITGVVGVFVLVAAGVVLGAVARLTVSLQQRDYALWQLVGVQPGTVRRVVLLQLLLIATVGAAIGVALAPPLLQATIGYVFTGAQGFGGLRATISPLAVVISAVVVVVVTVLAGSRAACAAGRVAVLDVLREPDAPGRRTGVGRWIGAALLVAAAVGLTLSERGHAVSTAELPLLIAGALAAAAITTVGAAVFPLLLRAWTAAVPARASASWYLARATTADAVSRGAATIGPLLIAVALAGVLFSVDGTLRASGTGGGDGGGLSPQVVVLLLGGPVLIAVVGTAVTVFMSGRVRGREFALLRAAGASGPTVLLGAAWEAVVYVGTALIGALVVMVLAAVAAVLVAASTGSAGGIVVAIVPALAVAGVALVLMLIATVVPTWVTLRADVPSVLAAE